MRHLGTRGTGEGEGDLLANRFNFSSPVSHCLQVTFQDDGHRVGASEMLHRRTKRGKTIITFDFIPSKIICPIPLWKVQLVSAILCQSLT